LSPSVILVNPIFLKNTESLYKDQRTINAHMSMLPSYLQMLDYPEWWYQ